MSVVYGASTQPEYIMKHVHCQQYKYLGIVLDTELSK